MNIIRSNSINSLINELVSFMCHLDENLDYSKLCKHDLQFFKK
jgi:hypothetical protein